MRDAVIVSYARTGLAKAARGGFNITPPMSMAAHAIKAGDGDVFLVAWRLVNPRGLHGLLTLREVERAGDTEREPELVLVDGER